MAEVGDDTGSVVSHTLDLFVTRGRTLRLGVSRNVLQLIAGPTEKPAKFGTVVSRESQRDRERRVERLLIVVAPVMEGKRLEKPETPSNDMEMLKVQEDVQTLMSYFRTIGAALDLEFNLNLAATYRERLNDSIEHLHCGCERANGCDRGISKSLVNHIVAILWQLRSGNRPADAEGPPRAGRGA
jgi:hypothetical protein